MEDPNQSFNCNVPPTLVNTMRHTHSLTTFLFEIREKGEIETETRKNEMKSEEEEPV